MIYDFDQTRVAGNNRQNEEYFSVNSTPVDSNVNQLIADIAKDYGERVEKEQWSDILNHLNDGFPALIPNSQPNNLFPTSLEPPKITNQNINGMQNSYQQAMCDVIHHPMVSHELTSMMSSGFSNSDSFMKTGYSHYNSDSINTFNPQYVGGSSIKNVASTKIFSNSISATEAFDGGMVRPGSHLHSVSSSSAQNFHCRPPFHQAIGQYPSSTGENQIVCTMDPQQSNQWVHQFPQNDQSNRFKIPRPNSGKTVQGRPRLAEANSSQSCNGLNCNRCGSGTSEVESRKRKHHFELLSNPSWISSGTLMEVLARACLPDELPPLDQVSQDYSALLSQQRQSVQLSNLEKWQNNSEDIPVVNPLTMDSGPKVNSRITVDAMPNNQVSKRPEGNRDATNDELKESPKFCFEEKTSDKKEESIQGGSKQICGFNTTLNDYESELESMHATALSPLDLQKTKTEISSFDGNGSGLEARNIKLPSASLTDSFTASQIKEYLSSFIQHNKEFLASTISSVGQNLCQLCSKDKLLLAPAPIYCSSCDSRIKQNVGYYRSTDEENTNKHHSICMPCFKGSRGSIRLMGRGPISKADLQKAKNDDEVEDSWVQCDRCQNWQHRICGLYISERDEAGKAEYVCPKCCLKEIENGTRIPSPRTVLGAKDLPRTNLSDHIEQRLFRCMKQEREETAKLHGIELEEVPEAEGLVVRVVVSVDKELEVKQQFRDIFDGQDYPEKLAYRSKLILLFQRGGGVDLCLFGMYVQEFGSECDGPNKRCVYISYLDSVKYFQPERKTPTGESLRTFVYHEILIGYLEYCKKRGFATCYIWACPLQEGVDYIFFSHPKTQKTPKRDRLCQWYKLMIRKAAEDGIVVDQTNLYNQFFVPIKGGDIKISAARLPYFHGDYWSEAAQIISKNLEEEEKERLGGFCSKSPTKRILKANSTRDALVMQKLGESILCSKENFMIIRLQHMCTSCNEIILSGSRWCCNQCNKIQLCSRCFDAGEFLSRSRMHSCHSDKSKLSEEVLTDVPLDTKDKDDVLVNKFIETRDDFLNVCQKSQFQFDTLAHAKYSSMMILYHFTHSLVVQPKAGTCHTHNLTHPSIKASPATEIEQPQKQKVPVLKRALNALAHASRCKSIQCPNLDCRNIRKLIHHASECSVRVRNGCQYCQRAWWILKKHAQMCIDSNCRIPGCMRIRRTIAASSYKNKQDPLNY